MRRVRGVLRRLGQTSTVVVALGAVAALAVALAAFAVRPIVVAVVVGIVLVILAVVASSGRSRASPAVVSVATIAIVAVLVSLVAIDRPSVGAVLTATLCLVVGVIAVPVAARLVPRVRALHLPGAETAGNSSEPLPFFGSMLAAGGLLCVLLGVEGILRVVAGEPPPWLTTLGGVVVLAGAVLAHGLAARRLLGDVRSRRDGSVDRAVTDALEAYQPEFFIHYSGLLDGGYQVQMWLPLLARTGRRHAILVRDHHMIDRLAELTDVPIVSSPRVGGLDACLVPSVRAIFYVNTDPACVDGVRHLDRTHVHLNHGDSDKPSSYHPMIAMFDQVFVAGQAAVDRFARHGVVVPAEKFVLVGRPQMAEVADHNTAPVDGRRTVLYAPTWRGGVRDMSFSSLEYGHSIVAQLLDRGVRVLFRPHPYSSRDAASATAVTRIDALLAAAAGASDPHLMSGQTADFTVAEVFNLSDALVTDVSSLASDYLQSGKPFAVVDVAGADEGTPTNPDAFPVLRAGYPLDPTTGGATLDVMLGDDPLAVTRRELRTYYLGDVEENDQTARFVEAALRAIDDTR